MATPQGRFLGYHTPEQLEPGTVTSGFSTLCINHNATRGGLRVTAGSSRLLSLVGHLASRIRLSPFCCLLSAVWPQESGALQSEAAGHGRHVAIKHLRAARTVPPGTVTLSAVFFVCQ